MVRALRLSKKNKKRKMKHEENQGYSLHVGAPVNYVLGSFSPLHGKLCLPVFILFKSSATVGSPLISPLYNRGT